MNIQILRYLQTILIQIKHNKRQQLKDRTTNTIPILDASDDHRSMTLDHFNEQIMDADQWYGSGHLHSSKYIELAAFLTSIRSKQQTLVDLETKHILLKTDNTITDNLDIKIYTIHHPELENSSADALIRLSWIGDYQINPSLINEAIQQINFKSTLDAFANKLNKKLKRVQEETVLIISKLRLYKYKAMLPSIQNQVTLGPSDQVQIKGKTMKEFTKFPSRTIEMTKINIKKQKNCILPETRRKRQAGLTPLSNYLEQDNINISSLLGNKPDVELFNAQAWNKELVGPKLHQRMMNMKMH
ncbi:MAG: hypothetical protein EZS28_009810 [Streblomastix strix]|uniref:Uncharacterized protein n=1 Tax=Streblomastix strix TaxID=222440 RepID=A0A5J4WIW3_9EUKA|nr:MAG: hypothetical protein EZS28_009810 [Streblomastix strix]